MVESRQKNKKLVSMAMLCALAYLVMLVGRIPIVLFLKYDPKDIVIAIGGFLYGPVSAFVISVVVALVELPISETGIIGCIMNLVSSAAFACTAAYFYSRKRTLEGAALSLVAGVSAMVSVMLLWNYFLTPIYMGYPRDAVADMLLPVFLPFNLLKGGLNAAFTMMLYKPVVSALRAAHLVPESDSAQPSNRRVTISVVLMSLLVVATCIMLVLVLKEVLWA